MFGRDLYLLSDVLAEFIFQFLTELARYVLSRLINFDMSIGVGTGLWVGRPRNRGLIIGRVKETFLLSVKSRQALVLIQPPIQRVRRDVLPEV
jgi:hypothetical protein